MSGYEWDERIQYLRRSKELFYNDDYLEFLVSKVWKIEAAVNLFDFGCGFGYLGLKLLPLLPTGSTYTGLDLGSKLLEEGRRLFASLPYEAEFLHGDIQEYEPERKYDIALCHAFLLHMPNPEKIIGKMIASVVDSGMVIAFEPHWIANSANFHLDGHPQSSVVQLGMLQKLYERDAAGSGKNGNIGIQLPAYFSRAGLRDVGCRVTDKVNVLHPGLAEDSRERLYRLFQENGYADAPDADRDAWIDRLVGRGASPEEAQTQYENELRLSQALNKDSCLTYAPNMMITYGKVKAAGEAG
ncbi:MULTISPECIES: methyltransferase domain-containing protein [unclassified Paenibacillus]|uniref:methyltransferase n=1 Tax=unclassified Paenibacillus TaxID=185978 RepID=UPI000955A153|nr:MULTISPECIES: methyltransferase domain-containing protein [unclassified Paenibacillus]ASS65491.1 class I SAM-dependent methyltransferase [Paenibacillus sp. RUD330]SIQ34371.1 Methyltransferase domain-containing protein [Paenibacillus sp. RU4X]SIQ56149.1 Methyltransferase domain-containing protein [Paenibacillus sp. RU4T]